MIEQAIKVQNDVQKLLPVGSVVTTIPEAQIAGNFSGLKPEQMNSFTVFEL